MANTKRRASQILDDALGGISKATRRRGQTESNDGSSDDRTRIDNVNILSAAEFQKQFIPAHWLHQSFSRGGNIHDLTWIFKSAEMLSEEELNSCFDLIEATSRKDYESSGIGWHPRRKKREMRQDEMRYLLGNCPSSQCRTPNDSDLPESHGFLSFMLTHDSIPVVPTLYVYEIHLSSMHRRLGIGEHLMQTVEDIARSVGAKKVMLTCFVSNTNANAFYSRLGYTTDPISPEERRTRTKVVKPEYIIMSKLVAATDESRVCSLT